MGAINLTRMMRRLWRLSGFDLMDIRRRKGNELVELHSNVPCIIDRRRVDMPQGAEAQQTNIDTQIQAFTYPYIDVRNGDFLILKKTDGKGRVVQAFQGAIGLPFTFVGSHLEIQMVMQQISDEVEDITPPPAMTDSQITLNFVDLDNNPIRPPIIVNHQMGQPIRIDNLAIEGFYFVETRFQKEVTLSPYVEFTPTLPVYHVYFIYDGVKLATGLKLLLNSQFRRNNGTVGSGLHWDETRAITSIDEYTATMQPLSYQHHATFAMVQPAIGLNITNNRSNIAMLMPMRRPVRIVDITGNTLTFVDHTLTEQQEGAYFRL